MGGMHSEQGDDTTDHGCCAPTLHGGAFGAPPSPTARGLIPLGRSDEFGSRHTLEQVPVPGQTFRMGDARGDGRPGDGETPVHPVSLDAFSIDATSVTNDDFARFVTATNYRTEAESFGYSAVFHLAFSGKRTDVVGQPQETPWWLGVRGADWRHPGGRGSSLAGRGDHPVVHVSWNDAVAYCSWADRSLPTEAQWEAASRAGSDGARYPWGDDLAADDGSGAWRLNIWQGVFPTRNTVDDGFLTTAPVRTYAPNRYGVWQTVGNVWEWCADVWADDTYARDAARGTVHEPKGPTSAASDGARVMRGGSYLCHDSYCNRYRNAARTSNTPDSSMGNAGFRTVNRRRDDG